jgi:hypothetical protein
MRNFTRWTLSFLMILTSPVLAIEPEDFDRLDGHGPTKKRVDVIEWEGNLEIHVYPKGSLRGLGLKIDRTKKDKPVMVIAYRFTNVTYTLYRRAILSVPLNDSFKVYEETTADDYDKIMISNNTLTSNVKPFVLDATPTQLYPDHYVAGENPNQKKAPASVGTSASGSDAPSFKGIEKAPLKTNDEDGGIRSFHY